MERDPAEPQLEEAEHRGSRDAFAVNGNEGPLTSLAGWGRHESVEARVRCSESLARDVEGTVLSRGLGRAYGDAALPPPGASVAVSVRADRILGFDSDEGVLRAEAGLSLQRLKEVFLPRGWFTPVSPGTQFVTVGGMVAADVHGKNHHVEGTLGRHVLGLTLRLADGRVVRCSRKENSDLFHATVGGMGLTGHILEVELRLSPVPSPWIWEEKVRFDRGRDLIAELRGSGEDWPFTVAWSDLLARGRRFGRGILMRGRWSRPEECPRNPPRFRRSRSVPLRLASLFLRPPFVRAFNSFYLRAQSRGRGGGHIVHPDSFFYPLDRIRGWNRLYGRRGFTQYQCVLPPDDSGDLYDEFLETLRRTGAPCYLCVIKDCGEEGEGLLSFPRPGVSFALDLPVREGETRPAVASLNEFVIRSGGRVYLAKDAFSTAEEFRAMERRLDRWNEVRRQWAPRGSIISAQSIRLLGDELPAS